MRKRWTFIEIYFNFVTTWHSSLQYLVYVEIFTRYLWWRFLFPKKAALFSPRHCISIFSPTTIVQPLSNFLFIFQTFIIIISYPVYRLLSLKQGLDVLVALFTTLLQVTLSNALSLFKLHEFKSSIMTSSQDLRGRPLPRFPLASRLRHWLIQPSERLTMVNVVFFVLGKAHRWTDSR